MVRTNLPTIRQLNSVTNYEPEMEMEMEIKNKTTGHDRE